MQRLQGLFWRNQSGFTLVELLLVVVLIGILAVTIIPKDTGSQILKLDAASKKVQADLRYAQNLAMTTGDSHGLRITGAGTYQVYNVVSSAIVESPYDHEPMTENFAEDYLGVTFDVADQAVNIRFNAYGQPTLGGGESIMLRAAADSKLVQITTTSGFVSVL